ncbi:MAG: EAL domain-containing protein [Chloroflexota bacterium]|nr:EAL domain-containing protein [Chloroflexota bacterium]
MPDEATEAKEPRSPVRRWAGLRSPAVLVIAITTCLAVVLGLVIVSRVGDQVAQEGESLLERHASEESAALQELMAAASRDIRLARQNVIFEEALAHTSGQLLPADRQLIEAAITYLGDRYQVDEICVIRADGLETARWVGGRGVAPVSELSPDERLNNPAVLPTVPLPDDAFYQSDPYISPDSNRWVIGTATPIVLPSGEHAGILHFEIPIQRFVDELAGAAFGGSSYGLLLDHDGHLLSGPQLAHFRSAQGIPNDPRTAPFPLAGGSGSTSWRQAVASMLGSPSGNVAFDEGGVSYRASYRSIPGSDRVVAVVSPTKELYADAERDRLILGVTVGPLILLIILVSGWFTHRLTGANRRLETTNELLADTSRASSELAEIVRAGDDAMMSVDLDGTIATWNDGADRMYGLAPSQAVGSSVEQLFQPNRVEEVSELLATVAGGEPVQRHETIHQGVDGSAFDASVTASPIRDDDGAVVRAAFVVRDISDRKRLEEELAHQALHDALTGLPNRVLFQDRLRHSLDRAQRPRSPDGACHAVLFLDLDNFKLINDTMGHPTGDELLVAVAERINESLRPGDTAARLGGDEFTILLENVQGAETRMVADRLLERLREPFVLNGHEATVSASIGIVISEAGSDMPEDLLRSADIALYEAKRNGKDRHETFHPTMTTHIWHRLELESEVRQGLAAHEFILHYQPIIDLETGRIRELEALVRWQNPERGLLLPSDFIPLCEETGLIVDLGRIALHSACTQLVAWDATIAGARDLTIAVNVSPRELREPSFVADVRSALADSGLAPHRLKLEITETVTLDQGGPGTEALSVLRGLGVRLAIDDFGTGYSSLGYFRKIAVDSLKIDRLFIDGLGREAGDTAIVAAAVAFGSALGLEVTAEGIETEQQAEILRGLHCTLGQGYHLCRPKDAAEMARILSKGGSLRPGSAKRPAARSNAA